MSRHFSIWIVSPPNYIHSRSFEPQALALQAAFKELGFDVPIVTNPAHIKDYAIVLAANLLPAITLPLPQKLIIYNMEQIQKEGSAWLQAPYMDLLRRYPVWDYSARNIARLEEDFGIKNVALCGVGYMPVLTCIVPAKVQDIDVLFIGSSNERRMQVLKQIGMRGKNVVLGFNAYGAERDALISRAKIHINLHFYEAQVFEITRVSYLLANHCCVVSETGYDEALEAPLRDGVAFAPYEKLADTCMQLLEQENERAALIKKGFECFRQLSQVPMLERALVATKI